MRILIIGTLALVIAVGGWVALNKDTSTTQKTGEVLPTVNNTPSPESSQTTEISYSSDGFSPNSLTINVGDTVTFINNRNKQMWVASNPHPIHTDLSEFDNRKGVSNAEAYVFTFKTPGEYSYHNHLSPGDGGTIIVK